MLCLLWFCFTSLSDWLKMLAPLFQPIGDKTKTNRDLLARVFPRLMLFSCTCFNFSLVHFVFCSCCDWLEQSLWFWSYDSHLKTALIRANKLGAVSNGMKCVRIMS